MTQNGPHAFFGEATPELYIEAMNVGPTIKRLLTAIFLSALTGGLAYGVTVWLAPDSVSALLVASIAAAVTALVILIPNNMLEAFGQTKKSPLSASDSPYHSQEFRLTNYTGHETFEYRPEEDDPNSI